ncbi:AtpZ/AtpI family protein [Nonomuraea sp. NPDC049649]|uniref:AtpZ/AtpI family protein n=1 Tax=Nonomuraea sp. NPDC049649 TaxID=3155776 RepID=UPI0034356047
MSAKERRPEDDGRDFADAKWSVPGYLLGGVAVYGGIGWLLDRWLDTSVFFPIGAVLGLLLAGYLAYRKFSQ